MSSRPTTTPPSTTSPIRTPWYQHFTLDLLVRVLSRSIFHPAITLIFYLCLASVHKHRTPLAYYTLYYTAFLAIVETLVYVNHRLYYGRPRTVNWSDEVVIITGGGSGLGRVLVEMLVRKSVRVGVLDIRGEEDVGQEMQELMEVGDLCWVKCDVGDESEVKRAVERVKSELGPPTILINNAARPILGLSLLPSSTATTSLSSTQALQTLTTNTVAHFNTLSAILPSLISAPNGGTIVTISSILCHLDPARLSDYVASKSAISSVHHCLEHEIRSHSDSNIKNKLKNILVEIGQMNTPLFSDRTKLPWYANFSGPILDAKDVAKEIMNVLDRGDSGVVRLPFYAKLMPWYGVLPCSLQMLVRWFSGIDAAIVSPQQNGVVSSKADRFKVS